MIEENHFADELNTVSPDAGVEPTIEAARKEEEEYWKEVAEAPSYFFVQDVKRAWLSRLFKNGTSSGRRPSAS